MERPYRRGSQRLALGILYIALVIGTCSGGDTQCLTVVNSAQQQAGWLTRQAAAMHRDYRDVLDQFSLAPRYTLDATLDVAAAKITGRLTLQYTNVEDTALDDLIMRLWPNADTVYGGGSLLVEDVTRRGRDVSWRVEDDPTILSIPLDPPLEPGDRTVVEISFVGQLPRSGASGYRIYHASDAVISLSGWHPILAVRQDGAWNAPPVPEVGDANLADIGLYEVHLRTPASYEVVATGTELGREEVAEGTLWHLVSGPARGFAVIVSDRLQREQATVSGIVINSYTLAEARANVSAQTALDLAVGAFRTFQQRFGPYPFSELDMVETYVSIGGYEFSGLVAVEHDIRRRGSYSYYRWLVAHEIAHQWFFGLVGNDSVAEPWLDESLATYAVVLYIEEEWGPAAAQALLDSYTQSAGRWPDGQTKIARSALDFAAWYSYRSPIYYRGALFLDALRKEMGDPAFFELMQRYVATYSFEQATTADFVGLAQEISTKDLQPLMDRWLASSAPNGVDGLRP
jgi:hypothetical protein